MVWFGASDQWQGVCDLPLLETGVQKQKTVDVQAQPPKEALDFTVGKLWL